MVFHRVMIMGVRIEQSQTPSYRYKCCIIWHTPLVIWLVYPVNGERCTKGIPGFYESRQSGLYLLSPFKISYIINIELLRKSIVVYAFFATPASAYCVVNY